MAPAAGRGSQAGAGRRASQAGNQSPGGRRGSQVTTEKPGQSERRVSQVKWEEEMSESSQSSESEEEDGVKDNILTIKVFEAKDLIAADRGGTSDPYVIIEFSGQQRKTKTIKQTINPKWNESFDFEIGRPSGQVSVRVYDYDRFNAHDFLGQVELNLANLSLEAVQEGWYDLQPRGNEPVSGQMHISSVVMPKNKQVEDTSGLDSYPWLNREEFLLPPPKRTQNIIRIYLATTFVDFQDEVGKLHAVVFPKVQELCLTRGYTFSVVDMRWGLDEKQDRVYMYDPRIALFAFREIAECRRISPGANFFSLIGDRYGSSPLPMSLDKNEFMAIRGKLMEDAEESEEAEELLGLLTTWYQLDENQVPNRFILAKQVGDVSPSSSSGTPQHNAWLSAEKRLYAALKSESEKLLSKLRLWKYKVSVFEQEMLLGALLPEDAADHAMCFIRQVANLRVVNPNAAKFVDIIDRRGNVLQDNYKEVRPNMIDVERRNRLADLREKTKGKLKHRCQTLLTQWLGWTIGSDHLTEFCSEAERMLSEVALREMEACPRIGFLQREVAVHTARQRRAWHNVAAQPHHSRNLTLAKLEQPHVEPDNNGKTFERIKQYLQSVSDGSTKPMVVRGPPGSGVSGLLSLAVEWTQANWPPGAVTLYRELGLTPDSSSGLPVLFNVTKHITIAYNSSKKQQLSLQLSVLQGAELPIADSNFFGSGGTSDPYVQIDIGTTTFKTEVKKKTLDPNWGDKENFKLNQIDAEAIIAVSVWDFDQLSRNDLLGRVDIPVSTLEVNQEYDRWFAIPLEPPPPPEKHLRESLLVRVVAANDIVPLARRMSVDPYIKLLVAETEERTEVRPENMDPEWDAEFELSLPHGNTKLACELWDQNVDAGEEHIVGRFDVDVGELAADRTIDDWFDVKFEGSGRIPSSGSRTDKVLGKVHLVITKKVFEENETEELEEEEVTGPRVRLRLQILAQKVDIAEELDRPLAVPCSYLDLCEAFQASISHASASKPLLLVLDGINKLPSSDPVSSLRWLPSSLPRYTHLILGVNHDPDTGDQLLKTPSMPSGYVEVNSRLENRQPPPLIVNVTTLEPDECRKKLNAALQNAVPRRALTGDQRSVLLRSFNARSLPIVLQTAEKIAMTIPSFYKGGSVDNHSHALQELIMTRAEYPCRGRVDVDRVWKVLEYLAVTPFGVSEEDLRALLAGGSQTGKGPCPWMCWAEVRLVLEPLVMELSVDGCILLSFRHEVYKNVILDERLEKFEDFRKVAKEVQALYEARGEFDGGGQIDERKLRALPVLLQATMQDADYEDLLTDMHLVELRLCCNQMFDLQRQLVRVSPGQGGRVEDLVGFLEEYADVLVDRPRMLLQLALNMPNHTGVFKEGRVLDIRRRRGHFYALHAKKGAESAEDLYFRRKQMKAAGKGDTDLELLHEHAMEWKKAKPWLNWINKPQSRGQCKKVLRGHASPTCAAKFVLGGMLIASGSADRTVRAWSPQTAEQLRELGEHKKSVTVMALSPDESLLITGGEEGCVVVWSIESSVQDDGVLGRTSSKWTQEIVFPSEQLRFQAHAKRVTGIAFVSASVIVVSSDDEEVKLFNVESGIETGSFIPFRFGVAAVACTPPGKISLIAAAGQCSVKLVRGDTLEPRGALYGHQRRVTDVQFSNIGDRIATCAWDGLVLIWDQVAAREWTQLCALSGHTDAIRSVTWSPDDRTLVTASVDKTLKIWKMEGDDGFDFNDDEDDDSDAEAQSDHGASDETEQIAESHKGKKFEFLASLTGHSETVTRVDFHPQGSLVLSCSYDRDVRVWDVRVPRSEMGVASHSQAVLVVSTGKVNGKQVVVSAGADGFARMWEIATAEQIKTVEHRHSAPVTALCVSNSGQFMLTGSKDGLIKRWGLLGGPLTSTTSHPGDKAKAHRGGVACMEVLHAGLAPFLFCDSAIQCPVVTYLILPPGDFFVSGGSQDGKVTVWDAETLLDVVSFEAPGDLGFMRASFSSDGRFVISADTGGSVRVWSVEAGKEVLCRSLADQLQQGQRSPIRSPGVTSKETIEMTCVDFSPNGQFVAAVPKKSLDIQVWDASSGLTLDSILSGHSGPVFATSFAGDGKYLCSLGGSVEFMVWDMASKVRVASFLVEFKPTSLSAGQGWPLVAVGDVKGNLYFLEFVLPQPVVPEEEEEVTRRRKRLRSRRKSTSGMAVST